MRICGQVTRQIKTRGFGFILGEDGVEYFMHVDDIIPPADWDTGVFVAGKKVTFTPGSGPKGPRAVEVKSCL